MKSLIVFLALVTYVTCYDMAGTFTRQVNECMCMKYEVYCQQPNDDRPYHANAAAFCATRSVLPGGPSGRLAVLREGEVDAQIRHFISTNGYDQSPCIKKFGFWIGLGDAAEEGDHTWCDGISHCDQDFRNWASGEPNNNLKKNPVDGQDCVQLWFRFGHDGLWDDEYCDHRPKGIICEIPDPHCHSA